VTHQSFEVTLSMLDLLWFVLWCVPILTGLLFVLISLKERSRSDPNAPVVSRNRSSASDVA
jgi:hypothetical protein